MKVLDASVIAKWYKEELGSKEALQLKDGFVSGNFDIAEPDLVLYELANFIRYFQGATDAEIVEVLDSFNNLGITVVPPTQSLLRSAARISYKHQTTIYDAVYLALAKAIGAELITADKRFYEKVKEERGVSLL